jgi:hypothetical protein
MASPGFDSKAVADQARSDIGEQRDEGGGRGAAVCRRGAEIVAVPTPHLAPPRRMM